MPFGRGFGFRGWPPPWPHVGLGRGGLPRCFAATHFWGVPYSYPYGIAHPYGMGSYPDAWEMGYPGYSPPYAYGRTPGYAFDFSPWGSPYGSPLTPEGEKEWLQSQADSIQQQIDQINSRIMELEKE